MDEQIEKWKVQVKQALEKTEELPSSLPAPVGPAFKTKADHELSDVSAAVLDDEKEPRSKEAEIEPIEHLSKDKTCDPIDMDIDTEVTPKVEADMSRVLDLHHIQTLQPEDLLKYVQQQSIYYAQAVDRSEEDSRSFVGSLVGGCIRFVPCGSFNKDNSCPEEFIHSLDNQSRIHSCALCYFALCGMITSHRVTNCPLLKYVENIT